MLCVCFCWPGIICGHALVVLVDDGGGICRWCLMVSIGCLYFFTFDVLTGKRHEACVSSECRVVIILAKSNRYDDDFRV